jgi:hypothetical protein
MSGSSAKRSPAEARRSVCIDRGLLGVAVQEMAPIRKRHWTSPNGEDKSRWVADYRDQRGQRHIKTFKTKKATVDWLATMHARVLLPVPLSDGPLSVMQILALPPYYQTGIYFLLLGQTLQYVGQSENVFARVETHKRQRKIPFDT